MIEMGYALSSEESPPIDLVRQAKRAEEVGFSFALISDHYHPWIERQGHSPFVWSVIGAISEATERLQLGTGVTCPIMRMHPAIIAQAAATAATTKNKPMSNRYFEFVDGKSSKFWEIFQNGTDVTVRFGRIGTNGQTQTKSFGDEAEATRHAGKLIGEKTKKGYTEKATA